MITSTQSPLEQVIRGNLTGIAQIRGKCEHLGISVRCLGDLIECVKKFGVEYDFANRNNPSFALATPDPFPESVLNQSKKYSTHFNGVGATNVKRIRDAFDAVGFNWRAYIGPRDSTGDLPQYNMIKPMTSDQVTEVYDERERRIALGQAAKFSLSEDAQILATDDGPTSIEDRISELERLAIRNARLLESISDRLDALSVHTAQTLMRDMDAPCSHQCTELQATDEGISKVCVCCGADLGLANLKAISE